MRTTTLATTVSALAAAALLTGAGTATAEQIDEVDTVDLDTAAGCVYVPTFVSGARCMNLEPAILAAATGSIGYGSLGTGSLMDLISGVINTGSVLLSVDVPNATGSYAPGSLGSYGPEASIGEVLTVPIASLGGAS